MGYNGAEMFFFNAIFCLTARTQNSKTMNANLEFQKPVPIKTHQDPKCQTLTLKPRIHQQIS